MLAKSEPRRAFRSPSTPPYVGPNRSRFRAFSDQKTDQLFVPDSGPKNGYVFRALHIFCIEPRNHGPIFGPGIWHQERVHFSAPAVPKNETPGFRKTDHALRKSEWPRCHGRKEHVSSLARPREEHPPCRSAASTSIHMHSCRQVCTNEHHRNTDNLLRRLIVVSSSPPPLMSCDYLLAVPVRTRTAQ